MAESADEDVAGLAGQSSNKVVKKSRIKPRSKPMTRQSTGTTKKVARKLFETALPSDDNTEHQSGQLVGIDRVLSRLEDLIKAVTESISVSQATRSIPGTSSVSQLRREDIGRFNPDYPDPNGVGMIIDGNTPIFTDIKRFVERIESFLEDRDTAAANEKQMVLLFEVLLDGQAALWWSNELVYKDRRSLRQAGLTKMLAALKSRFSYDLVITLDEYTDRRLSLEQIVEDENRLIQFFQTRLRYAKSLGFLDQDNKGWYEVLKGVWSAMDYDLRDVVPAPSDLYSLEEYMKEVNEAKLRFLDVARMNGLVSSAEWFARRGNREGSSDWSENYGGDH
ncbi:hypothetical protein F4813DRAFT_398332 [Daldinia decipiens]|uniref:uncharacterized protein n=1 Tax=Daldinia decipiens TaxID=326647 RepID=UPI0020C37E68|nr:uncharacterized protein F4813DRAFT_398332 [Daldinia decipiens]KAI1661796.1 hypothetical protein F4813DRAFT_398332 [Daldinia decipiens]